jgi:hypothetical protein
MRLLTRMLSVISFSSPYFMALFSYEGEGGGGGGGNTLVWGGAELATLAEQSIKIAPFCTHSPS